MSARGVVAIVPARGASKSVPRKNARLVCGVPLLAYSIEAGLTARRVDRTIVSTDDDELAGIARRFGAEVPFMRPHALAGDTTPDLPVFQHALEWLRTHDRWEPEIVVQLRPTSPIRPPGCVDAAIDLLRSDDSADSVRSVTPASQTPFKMWRRHQDGSLTPLLETLAAERFNQPRQQLPPTWVQTGHVDVVRSATIRERASMSGSRILPLEIDPAYGCDIDTEADWQRAEWMLAQLRLQAIRPRLFPDPLRLVVFDFDGVLTDNRVWVTGTGTETVACDRSDGLAFDRLRALGIELLVLSTETDPVVAARCRKLRVACEQGVAAKGPRLRELLASRSIDPAHVIYVGNDVNDLECLRIAGCGVVVADAHPEAVAAAHAVLSRPGGRGAVRELCDRIEAQIRGGTTP